jgi:hypothetical protein
MRRRFRFAILAAALAPSACATGRAPAPPPLSNERTSVSVAPLGRPRRVVDPVPGWSETHLRPLPPPVFLAPPPPPPPADRANSDGKQQSP